MRLVLASASPRRAALLRAAGYAFEILSVDIDEGLHEGEAPPLYVRRLAAEKSAAAMTRLTQRPAELTTSAKATAVRRSFTRRRKSCPTTSPTMSPATSPTTSATTLVVLGADTAVVVDDEIFGKPRDDDDAARMLRALSGRAHVVITGVSLRRGAYELGRVVATRVHVASLSHGDISWYLASGEGRDKAGAYAIQGLASRFVTSIDGSYSNVVGLPVATVHELLADIASDSAPGYSGIAFLPRKSL
jgi:septum formation protein